METGTGKIEVRLSLSFIIMLNSLSFKKTSTTDLNDTKLLLLYNLLHIFHFSINHTSFNELLIFSHLQIHMLNIIRNLLGLCKSLFFPHGVTAVIYLVISTVLYSSKSLSCLFFHVSTEPSNAFLHK